MLEPRRLLPGVLGGGVQAFNFVLILAARGVLGGGVQAFNLVLILAARVVVRVTVAGR